MLFHWSTSRGGSYLQSRCCVRDGGRERIGGKKRERHREGQGDTEGGEDKGQEEGEGTRESSFTPRHTVSENVPLGTREGHRHTNRRDMRDSLSLVPVHHFPTSQQSTYQRGLNVSDDKYGLGC